jgi:hypothetical protein
MSDPTYSDSDEAEDSDWQDEDEEEEEEEEEDAWRGITQSRIRRRSIARWW